MAEREYIDTDVVMSAPPCRPRRRDPAQTARSEPWRHGGGKRRRDWWPHPPAPSWTRSAHEPRLAEKGALSAPRSRRTTSTSSRRADLVIPNFFCPADENSRRRHHLARRPVRWLRAGANLGVDIFPLTGPPSCSPMTPPSPASSAISAATAPAGRSPACPGIGIRAGYTLIGEAQRPAGQAPSPASSSTPTEPAEIRPIKEICRSPIQCMSPAGSITTRLPVTTPPPAAFLLPCERPQDLPRPRRPPRFTATRRCPSTNSSAQAAPRSPLLKGATRPSYAPARSLGRWQSILIWASRRRSSAPAGFGERPAPQSHPQRHALRHGR